MHQILEILVRAVGGKAGEALEHGVVELELGWALVCCREAGPSNDLFEPRSQRSSGSSVRGRIREDALEAAEPRILHGLKQVAQLVVEPMSLRPPLSSCLHALNVLDTMDAIVAVLHDLDNLVLSSFERQLLFLLFRAVPLTSAVHRQAVQHGFLSSAAVCASTAFLTVSTRFSTSVLLTEMEMTVQLRGSRCLVVLGSCWACW